MKYDLTSITDRHGKDSIAVDALTGSGFAPAPPKDGFDIIPMWVADMNFPTVPTVPEAIIKRTQHPFYGYFSPSEEYLTNHPLARNTQPCYRSYKRMYRLRKQCSRRRDLRPYLFCVARR